MRVLPWIAGGPLTVSLARIDVAVSYQIDLGRWLFPLDSFKA